MSVRHVLLLLSVLILPLTSEAKEFPVLEWQSNPPRGIQVGDIVFRKGDGMWTRYFIDVSTREKRFSHVGIIVQTEPDVLILHSDAHDMSGVGMVRTQGWHDFCKIAYECAVYRYDGDEAVARDFARLGMKRLGVPFDRAFDMSSTNALYCTEFIREVVNESAGREVVGWSVYHGKKVIAIDDVYKTGFKKIYDSGKYEVVRK